MDMKFLRRIVQALIGELLGLKRCELGIHFVSEAEITILNGRFLHHAGATDVITFNYGDKHSKHVRGDVLICPAIAVKQAKRYRTTWQQEVMRYVVHGLLHLLAYDDRTPADRKVMKQTEDRILGALKSRFVLDRIASPHEQSL